MRLRRTPRHADPSRRAAPCRAPLSLRKLIPMMFLREHAKRPTRLADFLPWAAMIAPGVILNKDGSFQRTLRFRGPDLDSATGSELIATSARLNSALKRLVTGWALYVEATRRSEEHTSEHKSQMRNSY